MERSVLVVDPQPGSRRGTVAALRYGGFETEAVGSIIDAGRRLRRRDYAGIVVDPGEQSAAEKVAELRARTDAPIIVVSASEDRVHRVECLDAGADDFVTRPFDTEELLARLRAVLRRTEPVDEEPPIVTDDFTIELAERRVVRHDGTEVLLSPIEWKLVETLIRRAGHLVAREELLASVWGPDAIAKTQYLRVHMASIRQKMEADPAHPRYFVTAPGLGLKFLAPQSSEVERAQGAGT